jgi:hypothetical protein
MRITLLTIVALVGCSSGGAETFRTVTSEQSGALRSAWISPDGTAYAAGGMVGGGGGLLIRWDSRGVVPIPAPGAHAFWWIHGVSGSEIYLAGELGEVHRFDGTTLTRVDSGAPGDSTLFGIWGPSGDDLWAVGGSFVSGGPRRVIRRFAGGMWSGLDSPGNVDPEITYFKVWGANASDVWIVGNLGVVLRDTGDGLERVDAPAAEQYVTVHGCGANDVYMVGGGGSGAAIHFDGSGFVPVPLGDVPMLSGVACAGGAAYVGGLFAYAARVQGGSSKAIALPRELADLGIHGLAVGGGRVVAVGGDLLAVGSTPGRGFAVELHH